MKRTFLLTVLAVLSLAAASAAQPYLGIKTGMMMLDVTGVDNIIPVGAVFGYEFAPKMSIEGEFNYRISGGDWNYSTWGASASSEWKIWTLAAYFVYRYPIGEALYLKGKAGFLHEDVSAEVSMDSDILGHLTFDASGTDNGLSFGAGAGYKLGEKMAAEAEFTIIETDVNYLSIGLNRRF